MATRKMSGLSGNNVGIAEQEQEDRWVAVAKDQEERIVVWRSTSKNEVL